MQRGNGLFERPKEARVSGIDDWFGTNTVQKPPRWKQAVAIWLAFFPVSLAFNLLFGPWLATLGMLPRVMLSTLALTPLMVYLFIPLSTRLLASWCMPPRPPLAPCAAAEPRPYNKETVRVCWAATKGQTS